MNYTVSIPTLALAALLLGGCGQMGPLYEPEQSAPATAVSTTPETPPATAETGEDTQSTGTTETSEQAPEPAT